MTGTAPRIASHLDRFARVRGIVLVVDARIDRAIRALVLEPEPGRRALTVAVGNLPQRRRAGPVR